MAEEPVRPITLTDDQKAVLARQIKDIVDGLATLKFLMASEGGLDSDAAGNVLRMSEHRHSEMGKLLGIDTESEQKLEKRHADIRRANLRVRELESMLGNAQDPKSTQMGIQTLTKQLQSWWKLEGFGHVSDISFGEYCCKVTFSCHMFGNFHLIGSDTPVSDKERKRAWRQSLADRGFVITVEGREKHVEDCLQNRNVLKALFAERLPNSKITKFISHETASASELRDIEVYIHRIEEIKYLPMLPAGVEGE